MKKSSKILLSVTLAATLCFPSFGDLLAKPISVKATSYFSTAPTGYDSADDVEYVKNGSYLYNWGAREEDCTFLSTYAQSFYTGNSFETLSKNAGGTSESTAPTSALYKALQSFMTSKHKTITSYQGTRELYRYTDCVSSNTAKISSFYSGIVLNSAWDSGATWNREHTWPNSKGLGGSDENDIMMLRPTSVSENSSRGNLAYGESGGYYDPTSNGADVRGDCARIVLYTYTRWGNTSKMWGTSGVMENLSVLLKWMKADPVDTWEMGRNDAVQAITGTRNVFVDYPEYAWLLFGKSVPSDMVTPSGIAKSGDFGGTDTPTNPDDNTGNEEETPSTPTEKYTAIATLHASPTGTSATAKGVVTAVAKAGFTFNDGTGTMYFYTNTSKPTVKVGDEVEVSGATSEFGGVKQFAISSGSTYTKKDVDVPAYTAPAPTVWDGKALDNFTSKVGEYVQVTADVSVSGKYINGTVDGATKNLISLVSPSDDVLGSITLSSTPKTLVITGYTCYLSGGKYVYIIATSIELPSNEEETPTNPDDNTGNEGTDIPTNPDDNTGNEGTDTPTNPDDNTGNEGNQGGENNEDPIAPPCDPPQKPSFSPEMLEELLVGCNGSITGGLTALTTAIGVAILLLKKKED